MMYSPTRDGSFMEDIDYRHGVQTPSSLHPHSIDVLETFIDSCFQIVHFDVIYYTMRATTKNLS